MWNGRRQPYGSVNINRPLSAYNVPIRFADPGPDGLVGSGDDGPAIDGFNLSAAALAAGVVNFTRNLERADSDFYTWEVTANRRQTGRWSLLASFATTWSRDAALSTGTSYTPNVFINADNGVNKFTTWQGKVSGTVQMAHDIRLIPILRHQSGNPFGRTFQQRFNYGTVAIKAQPRDADRSPNVTVFDIRSEKAIRIRSGRVVGFFDLYNVFNANAEQVINTSSGTSWLRPIAITPRRIARVGIRVEW